MSDCSRMDYLIECLRTAREELLLRVKHRDDWLKLQLFVQVILLALAEGIKLGGAEASKPLPNILVLSVPITFVLSGLYFVEDRLIGHLSKYIGRLSNDEARLASSSDVISNWDMSDELREYAHSTLPLRCVAQFVAYVIIPAVLSAIWLSNSDVWDILQIAEVVVNSIFWLATIGLVARAFFFRRKTGGVKAGNILRH